MGSGFSIGIDAAMELDERFRKTVYDAAAIMRISVEELIDAMKAAGEKYAKDGEPVKEQKFADGGIVPHGSPVYKHYGYDCIVSPDEIDRTKMIISEAVAALGGVVESVQCDGDRGNMRVIVKIPPAPAVVQGRIVLSDGNASQTEDENAPNLPPSFT